MTIYEALGIEQVPERLLLIDGHSALFRSFYAIPELTTSKGEPVNALYGFLRTLLMALREYPSQYVAVVFDAGGKTVRHETYPEYKATRKEMPEALAYQLPKVKEILDSFGIPHLEVQGFEADDVMATLARLAERQGHTSLLLTGDKDMAQIISDKVLMLRPGRKPTDRLTLIDRTGVMEKFGVPPERIADFLALVGDSIDNVPGVKGIGEKTAAELLREYGSLEEVLASADRVCNPRVAQALREQKEQALLSRQLVQLREAPLPADLCLIPKPIDPESLTESLTKLEFRSILSELRLESVPKTHYEAVLTEEKFQSLLSQLQGVEEFALDLETTGKDPISAEIVGIAIAVRPYEGYYIPIGHRDPRKQLPLDQVFSALRPFITEKRIIGQNLKYDIEVLANYGIEVRRPAFDAMIAHWLLHPDAPEHNLEIIVRDELGQKVQTYRELLAEGGEKEIAQVPIPRATKYAGEDAEVVCRLRPLLSRRLKEMDLLQLFEQVEMPLIEVLAWMERRGVLLDVDVLREQGKELELELERLREELFALAGGPFNPSSTPQVREILYRRLKLPVITRTKTGPATDAQVLRDLAPLHEFPGKLISFRELEKLRNTYIEKLPTYVHPKTGRVHTSFNQTGTATGRLSSSDPNLQSIPAKSSGVDIRRAFIAPPGRLFLAADYSQIELRILAHLSQDEKLMEAFRRGEDLHRRTAAEIFGVPLDKVDEQARTLAKRVNFGIIYGISPYGLSRDLGIPQSDAKFFIDRFFAAYPRVQEYIDQLVSKTLKRGYTTTILGRRRPILAMGKLAAARRNAINSPIQGSAADLMKLSMLKIHTLWKEGKIGAEMILQIHDELIFEVDEDEADREAALIRTTMEGVWELSVPIKVEVKLGRNWGEL